MQHKCDLGASRIKVFVSSSMAKGEPLEQRAALMAFFDRMLPLYEAYFFESDASPQPAEEAYLSKVEDSDIVILVLQGSVREGVKKEYDAAKRKGKRILAFICTRQPRRRAFKEFVCEVRTSVKTVDFDDTRDLIDKIERSLLLDLAEQYVALYEDNKRLLEALEKTTGQTFSEPVPP